MAEAITGVPPPCQTAKRKEAEQERKPSEMFNLDDTAARAWLTRVIAAYESEAGGRAAGSPADVPPIGAAWNPLEPGEEGNVYLLVRGAQEADVLTAPPGAEVDFEYSDDCDGGYFRFLLDLTTPALLKLASCAEEMRRLGERDATGMDAAMAILRQAQHAANYLLAQLSEFIAAAASSPSHGAALRPDDQAR